MPAKDELRVELRARRRALTDAERARANAAITALVLAHPVVVAARCVHVYLATAYEVATGEIIRSLIDRGVRVVVPWMKADGSMGATELRAEDLDAISTAGPRGVPAAPVHRSVDLSLVDVVMVPVVGVDRNCHRLGMGAGHYDRLLAAHPTTQTIGLAFDCQVVDVLPIEPHDVALGEVIIEPIHE